MKTTFEIQNLKCGGCANTIKTRLSRILELQDVQVNDEESTVTFTFENDEVLSEVKKVLTSIGYPVCGEKNAFNTKAKSFVSCVIGRLAN